MCQNNASFSVHFAVCQKNWQQGLAVLGFQVPAGAVEK